MRPSRSSLRQEFLAAIVFLALTAIPSFARLDEALLDELTGSVPNPDRKASEYAALYAQAFEDLRPRLTSKTGVRPEARDSLHSMIRHAGRPGNEDQREVFCIAVGKLLSDRAYPALGRRVLIRGLGEVGSKESVPILVPMLDSATKGEPNLARMSLENIPGDESGEALVTALVAASKGDKEVLSIGLIDSLASRNPAGAATAIVPLLKSDKVSVASAAAAALGRLGGPAATKALGAARSAATDPATQQRLELALLDIAHQRGVSGDLQGAGKIFQVLGKQTQSGAVRTAAMIGLTRAMPSAADEVVIAAVKSADARTRAAGITAASFLPSPRLSQGLAAMLPDAPRSVQFQILNSLAAKGDVRVQGAVVEFLKSIEAEDKDRDLQVAAIEALGPLGSVSVVELLLSKGVSKFPSVREAAQESLGKIRGRDIGQTIEFHARQGKTPEIRAIAIGLFMRNRDSTALTRIVDFAGEPDPKVSGAAIAVLRKQATDREFRKLLDLLASGKTSVHQVINAVCTRTKNPDLLTGEIVTFLRENENPKYQRYMLANLPVLGSSRGLSVLVEHMDEGKSTRDAALRALSGWPTADAIPEQMKILRSQSKDSSTVSLMIKGIARLVGENQDIKLDTRVRYVTEAFEITKTARDRIALLNAMVDLPHDDTAGIVESMMRDRFVSRVAASTAAALAEKMVEKDPDTAKALAIGITNGKNFNSILRDRAKVVLKKLEGGK